MRWSWGRIAVALAAPRPRTALAGAALAVIAAYPFAPGWFTPPVTASYARQAILAAHVSGGAAGLPESPPLASDLAAVRGADVFVIFLESYGAATYDRPEHLARLAPARGALAAAVAATGRAVVSTFVESPTFGGASWLAHASLLSGVEVRDGDAYNMLMTQRRRTLVRTFADRGYRTVALMPGLRQDWREGAWFYGFDEVYGADRLEYGGPEFGWWRIPDQYALASSTGARSRRTRAGRCSCSSRRSTATRRSGRCRRISPTGSGCSGPGPTTRPWSRRCGVIARSGRTWSRPTPIR